MGKIFPKRERTLGTDSVVIGNVSTPLTTIPLGASSCTILIQGGSIVYKTDGTDASLVSGTPAVVGDYLEISTAPENFRAIRQSVDATLKVEYFA
jgi:hypothetical protein